jgi:hypothetical protein
VVQAAARLRTASIPGNPHPLILCQRLAERSSPARRCAAGWQAARLWLRSPVLFSPLLPLPFSVPLSEPAFTGLP